MCCTPKITGSNIICNAATPSTFQVNAVAGNTYDWTLPADVAYTTNASRSQITITNWGPVTQAPKQVDIKVKMHCHCDSFATSYSVFVYPARNPAFSIQNLGNNGTSLTPFEAVAPMGVAGTIHTWEIYKSDANGGTTDYPIGLRNIGWQTSAGTGNAVYTLNPIGASMTYPPYPANRVRHPFVDLGVDTFYLIRHGMHYEGGICEANTSDRVIYISKSMMIKNLGDPKTSEFKRNVEELKRTKQANIPALPAKADEVKPIPNTRAKIKQTIKQVQ